MLIRACLMTILLLITGQVFSQNQRSFILKIHNHYSANFITQSDKEDQSGRYGYGIEILKKLGTTEDNIELFIGLSYSKVGKSSTLLWEDGTPEREEQYGKFPIRYEMWDVVHYLSVPFNIQFRVKENFFIHGAMSLDYPIGTGYFRERRSDDNAVVETTMDRFDSTKAYLFNTSVGLSTAVEKTFPLNDQVDLSLGLKFKIYTILAARSNDYFPHEDYERPYTIGLITGIRF